MKDMRISAAVVLISVLMLAVPVSAQDARSRLRSAMNDRDYKSAAAALDEIRAADRGRFELNNYDYLRGRVAEKLGDSSTAIASYQRVSARGSVLKEYALRRLASIARASGNLLLERTYLGELRSTSPNSLMNDAARIRNARSLFEARNFEASIGAFAELQNSLSASQSPNANAIPLEKTPRYRENLVYLAESFLQNGRNNEARESFLKLVNNLPNPGQPDDFALAGAKGLDRMEAGVNYGRSAPPLTDLNHLQRATIYQFNRDFADARLHYAAILKNYPQSGLVPDALYQTGRGYVQERNFAEAITWFERVRTQFPEHPAAKDALSQLASAYSRVGKFKESVAGYQKFIEQYADADNLDRAYLNLIDVNRDAGDDTEALKWSSKTQLAFKGKLAEALALFSELRIRFAQADWNNAVAVADRLVVFSDLGGTRVPGGTNRNEVTFMKALALENLKRYPEAIDVYLSIPDGRGEYYGWRASERLKELAANETTTAFVRTKLDDAMRAADAKVGDEQRIAIQNAIRLSPAQEQRARLVEKLRGSYASLPDYSKVPVLKLLEFGRREELAEKMPAARVTHQILADELLFLGLYDEGTPELERALAEKKEPSTPDLNYTLAVFYKRGDMAHRATAFIEPLYKNVPADFLPELLPRDQLELLYPAPYADALVEFAPPRGVDPRYVLSIMRQESRFRADVKSNAAARGLMQFISTTSNQIAADLKLEKFRQDDLYDPPTAVLFGSEYLSKLYKQFPSGHAAVAASYNGGEDNVARWMQRAKTDVADRYVPEIVFSQSKDYAYKVLANFRIYQMLYDENLRSRPGQV